MAVKESRLDGFAFGLMLIGILEIGAAVQAFFTASADVVEIEAALATVCLAASFVIQSRKSGGH